jgi:hypothetical protein
MSSVRLAVSMVAALAITGLCAATAVAGSTTGRPPVTIPTHLGGVDSTACFWGQSYTQETRNIIWPDSHTDYPVSINTIPAGGKVVLHGEFPHARFFSLTTSSELGVIRGHLYDTDITPDAGSTNPYLPGADRTATKRSYTVTIVDAPDPGPGKQAPNTLYGGVAGQAPDTGSMLLVDRIYLPDRGRDFSGGVGDPAASYVAADGTTATGAAACSALKTKSGAASLTDVNKLIFPIGTYNGLLASNPSPQAPAVAKTTWYKYFTPAWLEAPYLAGTPQADKIAALPLVGTGLGANPANGYVFAWLNRSFGPDKKGHNIAVITAKLPTTPATYGGAAKMARSSQLRYWSMCNNEGATSGKTTGPCLADEQIPIDAGRMFTIVVSLPQDRPKNATLKCGVAWMDYGTTGDGYTKPLSTMLLMRNLTTTAHPAFPQAVQNVATPSVVKKTMGAYLPTVSYTDRKHFQRTGCDAGTR